MTTHTTAEVLTGLLLLMSSFGIMWMYITWLEQEIRNGPAGRTRAAHAIIVTWAAIRRPVERTFRKAGITR
jgi:hypothetical protein